MLKNFGFASILLVAFSANAQAVSCYQKPGDKSETITELSDGSLIWQHVKIRVTFETGGAGTGLSYRLAFDKKGKGFRYEFKNGKLVFGGVTYVVGCR